MGDTPGTDDDDHGHPDPDYIDGYGGVFGAGGAPVRGTGGRRARGGAGGKGSGGAFPSAGGYPSAGGAWYGYGGTVGYGGYGSGGFSYGGFSSGSSGGRVFDAGSDPDRNQVPPGRVCDRLATIICAGYDYCCPRPPTLPVEQCRAALMSSCATGGISIDEASASPAVAYDIERATAAFTEFEKRASECDPDVAAWFLGDRGFRAVARGTVPPGGSCAPPMTPTTGAGAMLAAIGSCAEPEKYACLPIVGPQGQVNEWTCQPRAATGLCATELNCLEGFYCAPSTSAGYPECAPRRPNGAPCTAPMECASLNCDPTGCTPRTVESAYCY